MAPRHSGWIVVVLGVIGCAGTNQRPTAGNDAAAGTSGGSGGSIGSAGRDGGGNGIDVPAAADIAVNDGPRVIGDDALGDAACATATQRAEQVPLDIYIMMDSSGRSEERRVGKEGRARQTADD